MKKLVKRKGTTSCILKFDLKMKLSVFLFLVTFFQIQATTYSQNTKLSMNLEDVTVEEVLIEIENQSEFNFFYNDQEVDYKRLISINVEEKQITKILDRLFDNTSVIYEVVDKNIVLKLDTSKNAASSIVLTQGKTIKGIVLDESGEPLPGASVIVKGTNKGVTTDFDGNFTLDLSNTAILLVSYIGYATQEIRVGDKIVLTITLSPEASSLEEVVVIGYGTLSRAKVLGAVASIKSEDISQLPVGGLDASITGRVAGVQVVSSGSPGSASRIIVRGTGTLTAGRDPLIVVDGYPMTEGSDLNAINPLDIESISVLKDAGSTAIYGSRGANGVILVTTKTAKQDKVTFTFDTYTGFQQVLNQPEFLNAYQYAGLVKEARDWGYVSADPANRNISDATNTRLANGASPRHLIPTNFDKYLAGTPGLTDNNWLDDVFSDGKLQNYNFSVSGRNEKTNWFISGGYFNQEGLVLGSGYERYTAKVNITTKLSDKVKFGINLSPSISNKEAIVEGWTDSPMQQAILSEPFFTPFNDEGTLNISQQIRWHNNGGTDGALAENPVAIALRKKDETSKFRLFGNAFLDFELYEGLTFKTQLGGDFDYSLREQFRPSTIGSYRNDVSSKLPWAKEKTKARTNMMTESTLNYTKDIGLHHFNLLAGYSYQKERYEAIFVDAPVLVNNEIKNVAGSAITTTSKDIEEWVLISYFGRAQYDYDSKYLVSASLRKDGSSRFGEDTKFGVFPTVSAGWVVTNEEFFPEDTFINNLKVRYSWGKSGNNQIGNYGSIATLKELNGYLEDNLASGQIPDTSPNADLSWETSITNNIGIDMSLFKNSLNLGIDYFVANTEDMLLKVPVPLQSGFPTSLQNIGKMENKGLEIVISTPNINLGNVTLDLSVNFASIKNKVIALASGQDQIIGGGTNITKVGSSIGEFYGYQVDGIYKNQTEIDASSQSGTDVKIGDWSIVDQITIDTDNDGIPDSIDGIINDDDRTVIGSPLPDFNYGFNSKLTYKDFDLNVFIDGISGVDVLSRTVRNATNGQGFSNQLVSYYEHRWHPTNNPNGTLARPDYTQSSERGRANVSSAFIEDGSFLRIRNITLGYNLQNSISSKFGVSRLRIYATAKNPWMFTNFKGFNPEQSRSNPLDPSDTEGSYPLNKSFVIGLNVTF